MSGESASVVVRHVHSVGENNTTNEGTGDYGSNWWPCLLRLSWHSISYPTTQTLGFNSDPSAYGGPEPMFTMAIEHRQSQRSHPVSGMSYIDR